MMNPMDLTGKRILVTGGSSGLGRDAAILLSQLGAQIVLLARNEARLNETLLGLHGQGHQITVFDLTTSKDLPAHLIKLTSQFGPLDAVIHCAGLVSVMPLRMVGIEEVERIMQLNVTSAIMLAKAFRQPSVRAKTGSMVLVSSVLGLAGEKAQAVYCASKGALINLTRALALELASERLRVNCVAPALVRTEMYEKSKEKLTDEQIQRIENMSPLGLGQPRDISNAIAFLVSDAATWITGTILAVDGGYLAH